MLLMSTKWDEVNFYSIVKGKEVLAIMYVYMSHMYSFTQTWTHAHTCTYMYVWSQLCLCVHCMNIFSTNF